MAQYTPDPQFYDKQIKAVEKKLKKLTDASYDTAKRGYVVDGKVLSDAELEDQISGLEAQITQLQTDKKTFGKYGPNFGDKAVSNPAGEKFLELYDAAVAVEVTDFDSALQNLQAWKAVEDFVKKNKNIRVAVERSAVVEGERGRPTQGTIRVVVDPTKDDAFKESIPRNLNAAVRTATEKTEEGTVTSEIVVEGTGAAATRRTKKTVVDQAELTRRQELLDAATAGKQVVAPAAGVSPTTTAAPTTTVAPKTPATVTPARQQRPTVGGLTATQQEGLRRRGQVAGGFGKTAPAQPTVEPTEPTAPGGGGGVGRGGGKLPSAPKMNWDRVSAKFRELFPTQAWILDVDPAKYPDVRQVIESAVTLNETPERFAARFQNTSFYKELATTNKVRDIKALVGDAGFDSVPFNAFVTKAMNLGWEGDTLKFEAYKEAFRKDDTGQFVNPTAVTRIKKSNDYLGIANIGKAYFNQVSDDTIQRTLTGEMTTEDVQRQQREVAKARYGHLSPLIDQGLTLDEISGSFKTAAAQLLEVDPNMIDMSNAQYEVALNFGEEGKKRVMTNGEWQKLLRTDARYGWDKTENAKREARELANTISQAFGRII